MPKLRTTGVTELTRAFRGISRDLERDFLAEIKNAVEFVRDDAAERLFRLGGRGARNTAAKYRARVRKAGGITGIVDNPLRRVTGKRPDWGRRQMQVALLPALEDRRPEVEEAIEALVDALPARYGF